MMRYLLSGRPTILIALWHMTAGFACADEQSAVQHVIVVSGAPGTAEYGRMFDEWAGRWQQAADSGECTFRRFGAVGDSAARSPRDLLRQELAAAVTVATPEPLWLILIGHGTFDGRSAQFNLQGPDLAADVLAEWLKPSQRPVIVINCASCSAPFMNTLSGPDRIILTATKDGNEIQFCRFGGFLATAIGTTDADLDRDGQTSLLEAWLFAAKRTAEFYEADGRLATEHSLLEDNGDGRGVRSEIFEGTRVRSTVTSDQAIDGETAGRLHLIRSPEERRLTPEQREQRIRLEDQLEALKARRSELAEDDYYQRIEVILLQLAEIYQDASPNPEAEPAPNPESDSSPNPAPESEPVSSQEPDSSQEPETEPEPSSGEGPETSAPASNSEAP